MKNFILFFIILDFCLSLQTNFSQTTSTDTTKLYRIQTLDGNEYIGNILHRDSTALRVKTMNIGVIDFKWKNIGKIIEIKQEELKNGADWYQVLQSSRYFWSPNGYGLRKGEAYFQNIWVLYNQMGVGITDHFSVGLGLIPLFFFGGMASPVWITPKFSIPVIKDKLNLGIGALTGFVLGENKTGFGVVYGLATYGSRDNNLTLGLGYGYAGGSWSKAPVMTISGMTRVGKKTYLMTENYIFNFGSSNLIVAGLGGRSLIRKAGLDYGLALPFYSGLGTFIAIPWLGLTIPIESKYN